MREIINNIMTFYDMQVADLGVLVANSKKALKEFSGERKADRQAKRKADSQAERIENFAKDLTTEINDMLTRFYFYKKRKQMTGAQTRVLVDFAAFVKALEKQVCSLLTRFEKSQTFAERMDKEIKELETHVHERLREYDKALRGTSGTLKYRLGKYISSKVGSVNKYFKGKSLRSINR